MTTKSDKYLVHLAMVDERKFQDQKHGTIEEKPHSLGEWIIIMEFELAEAKLALVKGGKGRDNVIHEIIQLGACAMGALEEHGLEPIERRAI